MDASFRVWVGGPVGSAGAAWLLVALAPALYLSAARVRRSSLMHCCPAGVLHGAVALPQPPCHCSPVNYIRCQHQLGAAVTFVKGVKNDHNKRSGDRQPPRVRSFCMIDSPYVTLRTGLVEIG